MAHRKYLRFQRHHNKNLPGKKARALIARNLYRNSQIYRFRRSLISTVTVVMNTVLTESHGAFKFTLADLPNYTEFTALFDRYRIAKIVMYWMPRTSQQTVAGATVAATSESPPIITCIDYDDATAADYTVLSQYENAVSHWEFKPFTLKFKPRLATAAYGGGVFTSYANMSPKTWIDAGSATVEYYSCKWATHAYSAASNGSQNWDIKIDYYLDFMNPR